MTETLASDIAPHPLSQAGEERRRRRRGALGSQVPVLQQLRAREICSSAPRKPELPVDSMWRQARTRLLRYEEGASVLAEERGCFCVGFDLTGSML
eukprot:759628-Hanusia_phi.AAC.1